MYGISQGKKGLFHRHILSLVTNFLNNRIFHAASKCWRIGILTWRLFVDLAVEWTPIAPKQVWN